MRGKNLDLLTAPRPFNEANVHELNSLREAWAGAMEIEGVLLKGSLQASP
jgi:hypothetical protein